jgi:hypothetical protein
VGGESEEEEDYTDPRDLLDTEYSEDDFSVDSPPPETRELKRRGRPSRKSKSGSDPDPVVPLKKKRKRGRPRKNETPPRLLAENDADIETEPKPTEPQQSQVKRRRGRPRKDEQRPPETDAETEPKIKRSRGRPPKSSMDPRHPKIHKCQLCGKEAKNNWNLQLHIRGVHEGFRRYQCATCKKYYCNKTFLQNHVRVTHNGESNQFICPEPGCGKAFAYSAGLRVHTLLHTGETRFSCEVCGKGFRRSCDLSDHMASHSTAKPFVCEHCGCCFKTRHNLTKHGVIHDAAGRFKGKPPPTCDLCHKSFLGTWNLRLHIRTVHEGYKPLKCQLCGKAFSSTSNLKVHYRGFHKCARDANGKIILPPLSQPKPNGETEADADARTLPPVAEKEPEPLSQSQSSVPVPEINHFVAHSQVQPVPDNVSESVSAANSFSHLMTSFFNYNS